MSIHRNELGHRSYTQENLALLENIKKWKEPGFHLKAIRMMLSENGKFAVPSEVVREAQAMVEKTACSRPAEERKSAESGRTAEDRKIAEDHVVTIQPGGEAWEEMWTAAAGMAAGAAMDGEAAGKASENGVADEAAAGKTAAKEVTGEAATGKAANEVTGEAAGKAAADEATAPALPGVESILLDERTSKAAKLQFLLENLVTRAVQENHAAMIKELDYQFRQLEENAQAREQKRWEREEEHYRKLDELLCQRGRRKDKRKRRFSS